MNGKGGGGGGGRSFCSFHFKEWLEQHVGDSGAIAIAGALKGNTAAARLNLQTHNFGDSSIALRRMKTVVATYPRECFPLRRRHIRMITKPSSERSGPCFLHSREEQRGECLFPTLHSKRIRWCLFKEERGGRGKYILVNVVCYCGSNYVTQPLYAWW